jgi:thioredoxin-like negative regulator of GroEL
MENTVEELFQRSKEALQGGNLIQAVALLTQTLTLDANHAEARLLRGRVLLMMGDAKGAQDDAEWIMKNRPELLADVSGDYTAEGREKAACRPRSMMNPFGV